MTVVRWEGIPERYWPDTEKPWRVTWGIGCFRDYRTLVGARREARKIAKDIGDWPGPHLLNTITKEYEEVGA